ncbi:MAG: CapA family protein [Clostridia bacterium]|nr:CapA family protein [Clostridia bacterium]
MSVMRLTAAGDAMVFRRLAGEYPGFGALRDFIGRGDFRFLNLETTVHRHETFGAAVSGGSWFCAAPEVLEDMRAFGFNALSTANNHAMDYSHAGLMKTLGYIREAGFACAGTGASMSEAAAPAYVDTSAGRFALIGASSSFHPDAIAGNPARGVPARPGLNAIRFDKIYRLPPDQLEQLRAIADGIRINAADDIYRAQGYRAALKEGVTAFGDLRFEPADEPGNRTAVNEGDMKRVERSISEARFMADCVVVAIHSHEFAGRSLEEPADFLVQFAHRCVDAGADAVIGTGPHLLRPIEIYKGRPIFYSLGDFIIQLETIANAPADMYEKQGLASDSGLDALFENRSGGGKHGLYYERVMFETVVPFWTYEDGALRRLELMPVELNFGAPRSVGGWPRPKSDAGILERLAGMSEAWGTRIRIEDGIGVVEL